MTFSFKPSSLSILPLTEASVRTRVVSWKDAAEIKLRVCSEALVIPSNTGLPTAGFPPLAIVAALISSNVIASICSPFRRLVSPISSISIFLKHLSDDHFNMLVIDRHTLQAIDILNFVDEITGEFLNTFNCENIVGSRVTIEEEFNPSRYDRLPEHSDAYLWESDIQMVPGIHPQD